MACKCAKVSDQYLRYIGNFGVVRGRYEMKNVDIVDIRELVKQGKFLAYTNNGYIMLEDCISGERVSLGYAVGKDMTERRGQP